MAGNTLDYDGRISLENYTKASSQNAHQKRRLALIDHLLDQVERPGNGLDYGCGLGDLTYRISPKFDSIIGVDVTKDRVEWANQEFAPVKFYHCADGHLTFEDNNFDLVLSSVVINWVPDPKAYLAEIHRVLNTNGKLILVVKSRGNMRKIIRSLAGKKLTPEEQAKNFFLDDMIRELKNNNFEIHDINCYYDPPKDLRRNFKNLIMEALIIPMRLLKIPSYAHYYGILAEKKS